VSQDDPLTAVAQIIRAIDALKSSLRELVPDLDADAFCRPAAAADSLCCMIDVARAVWVVTENQRFGATSEQVDDALAAEDRGFRNLNQAARALDYLERHGVLVKAGARSKYDRLRRYRVAPDVKALLARGALRSARRGLAR
jgi:hypothetical protein